MDSLAAPPHSQAVYRNYGGQVLQANEDRGPATTPPRCQCLTSDCQSPGCRGFRRFRNAWALCGAAHLNNLKVLKAFDKRAENLALPDLADAALRGPTTQELLAPLKCFPCDACQEYMCRFESLARRPRRPPCRIACFEGQSLERSVHWILCRRYSSVCSA